MMSNHEQNVLAQIKQAVKQTDPTATAILFGSRATGKARKDSDWDILVLLDKTEVTVNDERAIMHQLYDVELATGEAISTLVYPTNDWNSRLSDMPLFLNIKEEGIEL